ncbi:MAG: diacylglycerol/lipid kinase family protein [Verrucomicrobiales bacterium]
MSNPRGIPLIHNPAARSEKSARLGRLISKLEPAPSVHVTAGPGSARHIAAELARRRMPVVAAGGGDGTVNEVVAGLLDAAAEGFPLPELGLMPFGTMNVFALEVGLPVRNIRECWEVITAGAARDVDLWVANGQPLVQLGGVGLDAAVVAETTWEMKRRIGPLGYLVNAARVLARPAPKLTITVDGLEMEGALILLGNGKRYGGPLKVFPSAEPDDGLLDVLVLKKQTAGDVLGFLAALATGSIEKFPGVWMGRGEKIEATSAREVPVELDGEAAGVTPLRVERSPYRLRVRVRSNS